MAVISMAGGAGSGTTVPPRHASEVCLYPLYRTKGISRSVSLPQTTSVSPSRNPKSRTAADNPSCSTRQSSRAEGNRANSFECIDDIARNERLILDDED
jgi:hypothetical protein